MNKTSIFNLVLKLRGHSFDNQYNQIKKIDSEEVLWNTHLKPLLLHAYKNAPFYSQRLEQLKAINSNDVMLNAFRRLPLFTKADIRNHINELTSRDVDRRNWYYNTTGGSTGEPIRFIQDELDGKWRNATLRYYYENILALMK